MSSLRHIPLWAVLAVVAACGEVQVTPIGAAAGVDAVTDGGSDSSGVGECITDLDCVGMKGKTPCNIPKCDSSSGSGKCVFKLRQAGELCTNPLDEAGECQIATCDAQGACNKADRVDGTACGLGACGKKCQKGACIAATAADYDDKNPCTTDYCDQGKAVKHDPVSSADVTCDDSSQCTTQDICVAGSCKGTAVTCNDGIACTTDSCDATKGCVFKADNAKCNDDDPCVIIACDLAEGCTATANEFNKCDDGNPCTQDSVDTNQKAWDKCVDGKCKGADICGCASDSDCAKYNTPCDGKFKCVLKSGSKSGVCEPDPSTKVQCLQVSGACVESVCDPKTGGCVVQNTGEGKDCDDGNVCTSGTICKQGACSGTVIVCDDKNPCTVDSCDAAKGCVYVPTTGNCDDGEACTTGDLCGAGGVCSGAKKSCDDGIPCTYDSCDKGTCTSVANNAACDDKNPCTSDSCVSGKGCTAGANDSAKCDDGNACTTDSCSGGVCKSVNTCQCQAAADCDDKNPCTVDTCSEGKCSYGNAPATQACSVSNKCMQANSGVCSSGVCTGGKPVDCSAVANACNGAQCNPTSGACEAVPKPDGTPCDADGNGCTVNDFCKIGKCAPGGAAVCPAAACNDVGCKSTGASTYVCDVKPLAKGIPCEDGKFCTSGDTCDGVGKCAAGAGPPCGGGASSCQQPVCDEASKSCQFKLQPAGTPCSDGKYCTSNDTCNASGQCGGGPTDCGGAIKGCAMAFCDESTDKCALTQMAGCCTGNTKLECDDGQICTLDSCDALAAQCNNVAKDSCCDPLVYANDFETGKPFGLTLTNSVNVKQGWQTAMMPAACPPAYPNCQGKSSVYLYYGDAQSGNFNFGVSSGTVRLPIVQVPKDLSDASQLTFSLFMAIENIAEYDKLYVQLQPIAAEPMPIDMAREIPPEKWPPALPPLWTKMTSPMAQWHEVTVPLAAALKSFKPGTPYAILIRFETVDAVGNEGMGVYIDNLKLTVPGCSYFLK